MYTGYNNNESKLLSLLKLKILNKYEIIKARGGNIVADNKFNEMNSILANFNYNGETKLLTMIEVIHTYLKENQSIEGSRVKKYLFIKDTDEGLENFIKNLVVDLSFNEIKTLLKKAIENTFVSSYGEKGLFSYQLSNLGINLLTLNITNDNSLFIPYTYSGDSIISLLELIKLRNINISSVICYSHDIHLLNLILDIFNVQNINFVIKDEDFLSSNESYNKALVYSPLGYKYRTNSDEQTLMFNDISKKALNNSEWAVVDKIINEKDDFRAIVLVSGKALWEKQTEIYRKKIIENGYLEGIIELPNKTFASTSVNPYLLVLSKNNKKVKLLDASKMTIKNSSRFSERERFVTLDIGTILYSYENCNNIKSIEEVSNLNNLTPSINNIVKYEIKNPTPLNTVAEVFIGCQYTLKNFQGMIEDKKTGYSILTSSDITDYYISTSDLIHIRYDDNKLDKYAIKYGDVIVTSKSSKVKVGVVDFETNEKIIVTGGMIIVRPNLNILDPIYLKVFFDSEQGQTALKSIQKGIHIVSLNSSDLANINIPLIDKEKQEKIAKKFNRRVAAYIAYQNEIKELENYIKNIYLEEMSD